MPLTSCVVVVVVVKVCVLLALFAFGMGAGSHSLASAPTVECVSQTTTLIDCLGYV
jgi:hypothetical protein